MGLISDEIRSTAAAALDSLLAPAEEGGLGKHCDLLFEPRRVRCPNCYWSAAEGRSSNHYKPGGPQPFPDGGLCPVCVGKGVLLTPVRQDIVLLCNWNPRTWVALPGMNPANVNVEVPGGMLQAKGFMKDLPRVLQARKMVVQKPIEGINQYVYALDGEPIDPGNILPGRYFLSMWRRA